MAKDVKKSIKPLVVGLRKKGFSYSEIQKEIFVPKSTLSLWLRGEKLTSAQLKNLNQRKISALKSGAEKRIAKILQIVSDARRIAAQDIKNISKRELWLMGVVLCWRSMLLNQSNLNSKENTGRTFNNNRKFNSRTNIKNNNKYNNDKKYNLKNLGDIIDENMKGKRGVYFSSTDPDLMSLFLKWLKNIGGLADDEIGFDIFLPRSRKKSVAKAIAFWSKVAGFPADNFAHIYFQKTRKKIGTEDGRSSGRSNHGFLRVRVRGSSMLYRQIAGWIDGIKKILNLV